MCSHTWQCRPSLLTCLLIILTDSVLTPIMLIIISHVQPTTKLWEWTEFTCDLWGLKGRTDRHPDIWGHTHKGYILPDIFYRRTNFSKSIIFIENLYSSGFYFIQFWTDHKSKILLRKILGKFRSKALG